MLQRLKIIIGKWTKPETLSTILSLEYTATYKPIIYFINRTKGGTYGNQKVKEQVTNRSFNFIRFVTRTAAFSTNSGQIVSQNGKKRHREEETSQKSPLNGK